MATPVEFFRGTFRVMMCKALCPPVPPPPVPPPDPRLGPPPAVIDRGATDGVEVDEAVPDGVLVSSAKFTVMVIAIVSVSPIGLFYPAMATVRWVHPLCPGLLLGPPAWAATKHLSLVLVFVVMVMAARAVSLSR